MTDDHDESGKSLVRVGEDKKLSRAEWTERLIEKLLDRLPWASLPASVIKVMTTAVRRSTRTQASAVLFTWGLFLGAVLSPLVVWLSGTSSVIVTATITISLMMAMALSFPLIPVKGRMKLKIIAPLDQAREHFEKACEVLDEQARFLRASGVPISKINEDLLPLRMKALQQYLAAHEQSGVDLRHLAALAEPSESSYGEDSPRDSDDDPMP